MGKFYKGFKHKPETIQKFLLRKGEKSPRWKGGRHSSTQGYVNIYNESGYGNRILEHRFLWEKYHNACLLPWSIVHHINENRQDNRKENLLAMMRGHHGKIHNTGNQYTRGKIHRKDIGIRICYKCGSNKTYITKSRHGTYYECWVKDENGWNCRKCYRRGKGF